MSERVNTRGRAWRKGGDNALYLGDGTAGQTLKARGTSEAPMVAIYSAGGALLGTRSGYVNRNDDVVVTWDGAPLEATYVPPAERPPRAPDARFRATVPAREES